MAELNITKIAQLLTLTFLLTYYVKSIKFTGQLNLQIGSKQ